MQNLNPSFTISHQLAKNAIEMLSNAKWSSEEHPSGARLSPLQETIPQGQGDFALRKTIVQLTEQNFHLLSPHFLRQLGNVNLRLILQCKRIGHVLGFKGEFPLPDGTKLPFESFNETFVFPMLRSSLALFSGKQAQFLHPSSEIHQPGLKNINGDKLQQDLHQIFSHVIWHDNMNDERLNKVHLQIHDPSYHFPILIGTGYDWHSTQLIFFKDAEEDYFIYCNRGNDCGDNPGWIMLRIGDKQAITIDWLKNQTQRLNATPNNYSSVKRISSDLKASVIFYCPMERQQPCGNCTYASLQAAILALLTLWIASKQFTGGISENNYALLSKSLPESRKIYKQFINFDCHLVLTDFLIDIKKLSAKVSEDNSYVTISSVAKKIFDEIKSSSLKARIGSPLWNALANEILALFPALKTNEISFRIQLQALQSPTSTVEELLEIGIKFVNENLNNPTTFEHAIIQDLFDTILSFEAYEVAAKLLEIIPKRVPRDRTHQNLHYKIPPDTYFKAAQIIINSTDLSSDIKEEFLGALFEDLLPIKYIDKFILLANTILNETNFQILKKILRKNLAGKGFYYTEISRHAIQAFVQDLMSKEDSCNLTEWNMWSSSRNTLILWDRVAQSLNLSKPSFDEPNSLPQFIQTAKRFPEWLQTNEMALTRLTTLFLSNTKEPLTLLPREIGLFTSLKILAIENPIDSFPKEFSKLTNLRSLFCSHTRMNRMPEEICSLTNLKELKFSFSPLHSIPKEIVNLTQLKSLVLEGSNLLPDSAELEILKKNFNVKVWT